MTIRPDLAELELSELEAALEARGCERFHARQLYRWTYRRGVTDFERLTDLSPPY
jgi:23S rRNA (adenine2503-C2)-methyltransferase